MLEHAATSMHTPPHLDTHTHTHTHSRMENKYILFSNFRHTDW